MAGRRSTRSGQSRSEAERARLYAARTEWHERGIRRRARDNTVAIIAGAVLVIGAVVSQVAHAQVTAPVTTPTDAPVETPVETPAD